MPEFHLATLIVNYLISAKCLWPGLWHLKCQKSQHKKSELLNWRTTQMTFNVIHNECYGQTVLPVVLPWFLFRSNYPPHFSYVLYMWVRNTSLKLCQCCGQKVCPRFIDPKLTLTEYRKQLADRRRIEYNTQDSSFQTVKIVEKSIKVLVLNFLISRQSEAQLKFQLR